MSYIWQNLIIDNLWVVGLIVGFITLGLIIEAFHKGFDNLSKEEVIGFFVSIFVLILLFVLG